MQPLRRCIRDSRGFSLIELISAILMLGILGALALPMFDTSPINIETTAQTIGTDLRFIQQVAMGRNRPTGGDIGIVFTPAATSYNFVDPQNVFSITRSLDAGVSISTVTISGPPVTNKLSYNKYGEPEFTGATASIVITAGGETRTIQIQQHTGFITIS